MKKKIAWILPKIIEASGGLRTIFTNINYLIEEGYECHAFIEGNTNINELESIIHDNYKVKNLIVHSGWNINKNFDLIFGTMWHTIYFLENLKFIGKKAYFIQDYEPYFYPMGGQYLLAENTYRFGNYHHITVGRWLSYKLFHEYGIESKIIDFCVNTNIYKPVKEIQKEFAVCFIYQPEKPHRGPLLSIESMKILKNIFPTLKIYSYGTKNIDALPKDFIHLGILSPDQINELYNKCIAGLCISSSNPSRIPFEMMASGLAVVDIYRENNLFDMPEGGILLAESTPESISSALVKIISDSLFREGLVKKGYEFISHKTPNLEKKQLIEAVESILRSKSSKYTVPSKSYKSKEFTKNDLGVIPNTKQYELLTFDIWDTVLRRKCHPDEIKLYTARYVWLKYRKFIKYDFTQDDLLQKRIYCERLIGTQQKKNGWDDEYNIEEVFKLWLKEIFIDLPSEEFCSEFVKELIALELSFELENSYIDNEIIDKLNSINAKYKIFLSDFYMSGDQIKYLLKKKNFPENLIVGYTSSDLKLNKRSGKIYDKIEKLFNISPLHHIHIGDNLYSDYFVPLNKGISAVLYLNKLEESKRNKHSRFYNRKIDLTSYFIELQESFKKLIKEDSTNIVNELYNIGLNTSVLLFNFILFITEDIVSEGFDKIYFFTREGEFFIKIYNLIKQSNLFDFDLPEAHILEVSRLSTFAPSIREITTNEFMRIWNLYSIQKVSALFKSLNLNVEDYKSLLSNYHLEPETEVVYPWADTRIRALFADYDFKQKLTNEISKQKSLLLKYFKSKGIENNGSKIAVVDIGWRGTIQDNLSYIFDKNTFYGYYFGLLKFLNIQPKNSIKKAFIIDQNKDHTKFDSILNYVSPIEMLFNSDGGSVKYYYEENSKVFAKRKIDVGENNVYANYTYYFQEGILSAIKYLCESARRYSLASNELKMKSIEILQKLINDPPEILAKAYFNLNHNESFGVGQFEDKSKFLNQKELIVEKYLSGNFSDFENYLNKTTWPQGFLKLCNIKYNYHDSSYPNFFIITPQERKELNMFYNRAIELYINRNYYEALRFALKALAKDPNRLSTLYLLYNISKNISMKEAVHYLKKILDLYEEEPFANNELARISFSIGELDKSIKFLQKIKDQNYKLAFINLSKAYLKKFLNESNHIHSILLEDVFKNYAEELIEDKSYIENITKRKYMSLIKEKNITNTNNSNHDHNVQISVLVATYNGLDYTQKFIESLCNFTDMNFELIIIDNNSNDDFKRYIKRIEKRLNNIKVIFNTENYGFPHAINQAFLLASSDNLLVVNNDIIFTEKAIEKLLELLKSNPQIGIVAPISNEVSGLQKDENAKYNSIEEMHKYAAEVREKNKGQILHFPRVAFLCTLIKREVIEKIGGLDERFSPGNYEDDDFCLRAQLAGFKTVIAKDVFIHHFGSKSFKANGLDAYKKRLETNRQIFIDKWGATPEEIWLQNKTIKQRQIYYPIDADLFKQYFERTRIHIADNELNLAKESVIKAIENYKEGDAKIISYDELLDLAGNIYLADNDVSKAQEFFEKELNLNPQSSSACYGLGQVFIAQENYEAAKIMFEWAVKNDPSNSSAKSALEKVNEMLGYELSHSSLDGG